MGSAPNGALAAIRKRPWAALFICLVLLSGALLLTLRSTIGFFLDDWALVLYREGGPSDWLLPHNEHIIVLPAALYKLSLSIFGMTAMPLHVLAVLLFLLSVVLLFLWLRTLVGEPASVLGCAVVLFLGAAAEDLVWAFQIGYFGSMATGLGALLLLRRETFKADLWACLLLVLSLLFSTMAIPLALAAAVQILFRPGPGPDWNQLWRRSWVFLVPGVLYVVWWLGWGHLATNYSSVSNALKAPLYALAALGYSGAVLTGAFPAREINSSFAWALPGLAFATCLAYVLRRRRRLPPEFLIPASAAISFWLLSALNYIPGREFSSSRYAYPTAILVLMMLGGAFAGCRPGPRLLKWMGALAVVAVTVNLTVLVLALGDRYRPYEERNRISLTALNLAERTVSPDYRVGISTDDKATVDAGAYLAAVRKYGSPGMNESEIDSASESDRMRLDQLLVGALPVSIEPATSQPHNHGDCQSLTADSDASDTLELHSPNLYINPRQTVLIRLGRFGPGATAIAGATEKRSPINYTIPTDHSNQPWRIGFQGEGKVTVCQLPDN